MPSWAVAVRGFLDALDVAPRRIPTDLDARVSLYRSLESHRAFLPPDPPALPDAAAAMAWLEAEHPTLLATQCTAAALGRHAVV